jgi:16S rRNA (uracil1498-N3)-methyltransferase
MGLPIFFYGHIEEASGELTLDESTSKHIIQVLRMKMGEALKLTDGKGNLFTVEIKDDNRKKCEVKILETFKVQHSKSAITIAISPIKNNSRFEWFLEKATEIGATQIVPLICTRTEKQHFKWDRMNSILISATLQSQQAWLPMLKEPVKFEDYLASLSGEESIMKCIAHCENEEGKTELSTLLINQSTSQPVNQSTNRLILIGPEGDFTGAEITSAVSNGFIAVAMGNTRLRTETAGIVAAALMCNL